MFYRFSRSGALAIAIAALFITSCSSGIAENTNSANNRSSSPGNTNSSTDERSQGSKITIEANSPADTVRVFYKNLREKKVRDAMYLTNMRPAMEGLTDAELKEFQVDFDQLAAHVPAQVEINGEVISGDTAVVTANLPGEDPTKMEIQQIKLRRENKVWVMLTVDAAAEAMIKKEGKNYFYKLRIDTHESEARKMLQKIADVQSIMAAQNNGVYSDLPALIEKGVLPADLQTADSTGYTFKVTLKDGGKSYYATATPAAYGKSGKLSFLLELDAGKMAKITDKDNGGQPMKK